MRKIRIALVTAGMSILASNIMAAPISSWSEQWYKAKYGHSSPQEADRLKAELDSTAFRDEPGGQTPALTWTEQFYRSKFGRGTPQENARQIAERESTAFREEASAPPRDWSEQLFKAKWGRGIR